MRNFRFISRILYQLKKDFSDVVDFYIETLGAVDVEDGTRTVTRSKTRVHKTIILDAVSMIKYLGKNEGFFDHKTRFFILDKRDVPSNFTLTKDHYLIYKNSRYRISKIEIFEHNQGFLITANETPEDAIYEQHSGFLTQAIIFEDSVEGEVE
jgi:hypothetical protein